MLDIRQRSFTVRGRTVVHYYVQLPEVVVILARDPQGRYLLVRQYRGALDREVLELPAGKCEPGESPAEAAARELEEETGYRPGRLQYMVSFHPTPGYSSELIHAFRADGLQATATRFDDGEELTLVALTPAECEQAIRSGELRDGKSILTLLMDRIGWSVNGPEPEGADRH